MVSKGLILLAVVGLVSSFAAFASCPTGAIANESIMVTGKLGMLAVEVCVTRSGTTDTYTYTVTNLGTSTELPDSFMVTGLGRFTTTAVSASSRLAHSHVETSCGTWWLWSSLLGSDPSIPALPLRAAATFSITVEGPTTPVSVLGAMGASGRVVEFKTLGPCACPDPWDRDSSGGCSCSDEAPFDCVATTYFTGKGTQIKILGDADVQHILDCDESWVRHGFCCGADAGAGVFRLFLDGAPVPLDHQIVCRPSVDPGVSSVSENWFVRFPAGFFEPGTYELRGEWESFATADSPAYTYTRTITLVVAPCLVEPIPVEPLADLSVNPGTPRCSCAYTQQKTYECTLTVFATVTNNGAVESGATSITLRTQGVQDTTPLPKLGAGESRVTVLKVTLPADSKNSPCPLGFEIQVDPENLVEETDEQNNLVEGSSCCS
jgi:hypothetical protein